MKNPKIALVLLIFVFGIGISFPIQAQTDKELLAELVEEEQDAVNALVLYPAATRKHILEATLHPEALIKMESIQNKTSNAFQELVTALPQNAQEVLWDLTRYPGLIHQLAMRRTGSVKSIDVVLAEYPKVIHKRAREADADRDLPIVAVNEINLAAESAFHTILSDYTPNEQQSLRALTELPEVLTILTDNIRLTLLVGHVYEKEPDWVLRKADSVHLEVARQNAQEVEDWKASLEKDPQAMEELNASVKMYNEEYGYDDEYYEDDRDNFYEESSNEVIVRNYYYYNYPYWLGYPSWYEYPHWRYYPTYYDWGFYYYPGRPVVFIGLPSFHFTYWYFHHGHHHHYYPHLSAHFVRHYNGHRRAGSSITTSVNNWQHNNRDIISDNWLKDDGNLTKRFKEYGEFESSREKYNNKNPKQKITPKDYVRRNEKLYPNLSKSTKEQQVKKESSAKITNKDRISPKVDDKPGIKKPRTKEPDDNTKIERPSYKKQKTDPDVFPKKKQDAPVRKPDTNPKNAPDVDKGKDYHKNTWEKSRTNKTKVPTTTSRPKVKTKTTPRKPKTKIKKSGGGQ